MTEREASGGGTCGLTRLAAATGKPLPGLILEARQFEADPAFFSCCGATGLRRSADGETTLACQLGARLARLRRLALQQVALPGTDPVTFSLAAAWQRPLSANVVDRLVALAGGRGGGRGLVYTPETGQEPQDASSIWSLAAAAVWRAGLSPHVVILGRTAADQLVPRDSGTGVLCVSGLGTLWNENQARDLSHLIAWAYGAMMPVFLELPLGTGKDEGRAAPPPKPGPRRAGAVVAERIRRLKDRSPMAWLAPEDLVTLRQVSDGVPAAKPDARGRGAAARKPLLPW